MDISVVSAAAAAEVTISIRTSGQPWGLNVTTAVSFRGGVGGSRGNYRFRGTVGLG